MANVSGSTFYLSPECQGGLFEPVDSYSTIQADLWSLGVILVNLACVRNPWKQASLEDETFRAYVEDPSLLSQILPLSSSTAAICAGVFARNPADRINLAQLRAMVVAAPSFSTPATMPVPPPIPVRHNHNHHPKIPRRPPPRALTPSSAASSSYASSTLAHYPVSVSNISAVLPTPVSNASVMAPPPSPFLSPFAQYHHAPGSYVTMPSQRPATPASTPGLVGSDPFYFGRAPSSASSSGSLPPTPGLSPIPFPETSNGKQLLLEGADLIPPLHYNYI